MNLRQLLDVVVAQRASVLELPAREEKALIFRRGLSGVMEHLLDAFDRVRRIDECIKGQARQRVDKDLHSATLLNVVQLLPAVLVDAKVAQRAAVVIKPLAVEVEHCRRRLRTQSTVDLLLDLFDRIREPCRNLDACVLAHCVDDDLK